MVKCKNCKIKLIFFCKNLCRSCYMKQYRKEHHKERIKYNKINKEKQNLQQRNKYYKNGGQPLSQNKQCSSYLGIHIAEQVLIKVFKNVQTKPYGHKGYDFICSNNYMIDVKSSCERIGIKNNHSNYWSFAIHKNKIANYFLLLAFNNRENLNPIYLWLIPGNIINDQISISISISTITKWDKYKLDINKVIKYCNILKGCD